MNLDKIKVQQAINEFQLMKEIIEQDGIDYMDSRDLKTIDLAIKALEAEPNEDWEEYSSRLWKNAYERGKDDALKALQEPKQEPRMKYVQETINTIMNTCKTDSIKDKAMRNAARFIQNAIDGSCPDFEKIQEPTGDLISRQAVLDLLITEWKKWESADDAMDACVNVVRDDLPSVTPARPKGKWIDSMGHSYTVCSECKTRYEKEYPFEPIGRFCPNCGSYNGADMKGDEENE